MGLWTEKQRATGDCTRRDFLASVSCLGAALWAAKIPSLSPFSSPMAARPRVDERPILDRGYASVRRIGEGVFATISDASKGRQTLSNGGMLVGRDAALLIEGHRTPEGAKLEFDALRTITQVPVMAAVDTHYHYDHSMGNAYYGAQGIPIWAHEDAPRLMVERFAELQGRDKGPLLQPLRAELQRATTEQDRERIRGNIAAHQRIFDTIEAQVVALPSRKLSPAELPQHVDLGGLVVILETHRGHTSTDLIIRVPDQNIVFTGDLLFNGWYPVSSEADMSLWLGTLDVFSSFGKRTLFVPGHGQVCGQEGVARLRNVIEDLREHALKSHARGLSLQQAQRSYSVPPEFSSFPVVSWAFCMDAAIANFYEEFSGK